MMIGFRVLFLMTPTKGLQSDAKCVITSLPDVYITISNVQPAAYTVGKTVSLPTEDMIVLQETTKLIFGTLLTPSNNDQNVI